MSPGAPSPQVIGLLQTAANALGSGRPAEARVMLEQVLRVAPHLPDALHLYGVALFKLGDAAAAERPLRQAITADKRQPAFHVSLGDVLDALARPDQAERSYRAALALNRRFVPAVRQLTLMLAAMGRGEAALQVIAPLAAAASSDFGLLNAHGAALKAAGRKDDALTVYRQAAAVIPTSGVAEHNVAAVLGDLGRHVEAEAAARRAFAKGLDAPETWLVYARALSQTDRYDEALAAFQKVLARRPVDIGAHRDLAQLIWMKTEDQRLASEILDAAIAQNPDVSALRQLKGKLLTFAEDFTAADAVLEEAVFRQPDDANLRFSAAQAAIDVGDVTRGLGHAERARVLAPDDPQATLFLCEALLAAGRAGEAAKLAERLSRLPAFAQQGLAYLATAWRLLGDERYRELYDYEAFVRPATIETPPGWASLDAYLTDVAEALNGEHRLKTHPLDQSLRHGSQISQVLTSEHRALQAFAQAVDGPIRAYMAALGRGKDPFRSRSAAGYRFQGAWSVKLRPGGGRHVDHLHPEGWISSACYIDLPKAVAGEGRQGWIKFGEPGLPTQPRLGPEHFVRPEPGLLVLFPSYMWHGTVPFEGAESRLTIAFDLVPAKA